MRDISPLGGLRLLERDFFLVLFVVAYVNLKGRFLSANLWWDDRINASSSEGTVTFLSNGLLLPLKFMLLLTDQLTLFASHG